MKRKVQIGCNSKESPDAGNGPVTLFGSASWSCGAESLRGSGDDGNARYSISAWRAVSRLSAGMRYNLLSFIFRKKAEDCTY